METSDDDAMENMPAKRGEQISESQSIPVAGEYFERGSRLTETEDEIRDCPKTLQTRIVLHMSEVDVGKLEPQVTNILNVDPPMGVDGRVGTAGMGAVPNILAWRTM